MRIVGPNCLGIIVPDVIKMGGIGGPAKDAAKAYTPGPIGVISRSGGMTTEMSSTLTAAGLGQSTAVSIGGDAIIGSSYAELMPLFEADAQTEAIVIYTEPGGRMEAELARWVTDNGSRLPIVAFMAGRFMDEMPGMSFGHAGTIVEGKEDTASEKIARLADAGIVVAERIEEMLAATPRQSPNASAEIQADTLSIMARRLVPLMTRIVPSTEMAREAVQRLQQWDFRMDADKVEPLLFTAWLVEPESASAIAEGLSRLLADAALRRRVSQGALRTARARDWNAVYERLIEQYRDAVERKGETRAA